MAPQDSKIVVEILQSINNRTQSFRKIWRQFLTIYTHLMILRHPVILSRRNIQSLLKLFFDGWMVLMSVKLQVRMVYRTGFYEILQPSCANLFVWYSLPVSSKDTARHPPMSVHSDLRPISLTPTISKQLEAILGKWILAHIFDQTDKRQYGSMKGRSTTHALIDIVHHWSKVCTRSLCGLRQSFRPRWPQHSEVEYLRSPGIYDQLVVYFSL